MTQKNDILDDVLNSKSNGGGVYLEEGVHTVRVTKAFHLQGYNGQKFICECVIEASDTVKIGAQRSIVITLDDQFKMGPASAMDLICAALGGDPVADRGSIDRDTLQAAFFNGGINDRRLCVSAWQQEKKRTPGEFFTKYKYSPVVGDVPTPAFPPPGWYAHPSAAGYYHDGKVIVTEAELRARG